jgi:phage shock protein A
MTEIEALKKEIYETAVEYNRNTKLVRDLVEKRQEYKCLLAQYEERVRIVEKIIAELDKKGMELTARFEKLEKEDDSQKEVIQ